MSAGGKGPGGKRPEVPIYTLDDFPFWVPQTWECIGVTGMRRRGKSALIKAWVKYLMAELRENWPGWGIVVFDLHDEHTVLGEEREDCQLGHLPQRRTVDELLEELPENPRVLYRDDLALGLVAGHPDMTRKEVAASYRRVLPELRKRKKLIVIFEELGFHGAEMEEDLHTVAACWGKESLIPIFCGQTVMDTPESVRNQWSRLITAQQTKRSALLFIKQQAGGAVAASILQLERKHYVSADLDAGAPELLEMLLQ